jgi:protein dithiol oxidoreductase (disulfide-forming)
MNVLSRSLMLFCLIGVNCAFAQPASYLEGSHYKVIESPVRAENPGVIEVIEVFWYGCPHCYALEPFLTSWLPNIPAGITFVRSPVIWNDNTKLHAGIFYVANELKVLEKIHGTAFDEIHEKGGSLADEETIKDMFVMQGGVSGEDFDKTWSSPSVISEVEKATARVHDYGVRSVPALIINGKYRIEGSESVNSYEKMLEVADFLIQKEKAALE